MAEETVIATTKIVLLSLLAWGNTGLVNRDYSFVAYLNIGNVKLSHFFRVITIELALHNE
jgi:hypothetical protein